MFSDRLRELRKHRGLTQEQLAAKIGVERSSIGKYEGKSNVVPSNDVMKALADFFGVTIDYLLERTDSPTAAHDDDDADLWEIREALRRRPEMHALFSASRNASKEDLLKTIKIIEALKDESKTD